MNERKLITLLVVSNILLFGAGLIIGTNSTHRAGSIRVYKMHVEFPEDFPVYGPNGSEVIGAFETDDGVTGDFPSNNVVWNSNVFNITINPSEFSTHFTCEINITTGEAFWYYGEWLVIISD